MDFETGVFRPYRFTTTVHLGPIQQDIPGGTVVEFDGSTMKWAGRDYPVPQLRAGINSKWLVPAEDTTSIYRPQPAGVRVRPAQSAGSERGEAMPMEEASEEEQIVGTVEGARGRREDAQKGIKKDARKVVAPRVTKPVAAPPPVVKDEPHSPAKVTTTVSEPLPAEIEYVTPAPPPAPVQEPYSTKVGRTMQVISEDGGDQEAEPVARIFTPAKQKTLITDSRAAAQAVSQLDNKPPPKAQKFANVTKQAPEESQDIRYVGPDGASGDVSVAMSGDDLADILPDAATVPIPDVTPNVHWDKTQHWRSRVQQAVELYSDNPAVLRQILTQESPNVAKHIRSELVKQGKQVE